MDDRRFDQDYIASRHTLHKLGGASLPPRPPSSRLRNPGYGNNMQRPATDEDLAAHLSPREFLPTLPLDPPSPGSTTSRSTSSTRGPTSEGAVPLSQLQLPQDPQMSGSYSLRPITGLQGKPLVSNVDRCISQAVCCDLTSPGQDSQCRATFTNDVSHTGHSRRHCPTPPNLFDLLQY